MHHNHLISLSEVMAMYLLVWSPVCWGLVNTEQPALAHLPTYMIFDDHDVTDDWNLSALWESTTYEHPFSRRIVGNALVAYLLCQGWGNNPDAFDDVMPLIKELAMSAKQGPGFDHTLQDQLIDTLLKFEHWHYNLQTSPRIIVLDTRTRRWRSELNRARPSGLLGWEALSEFQQDIMGETAVIVVSPAPMFGVKLIEAIQRVFTYFGRPLVVDAENWMAHRGAASALPNIVHHTVGTLITASAAETRCTPQR